ncbi:MAG: DUF6838 family protein [Aminipila sp.]
MITILQLNTALAEKIKYVLIGTEFENIAIIREINTQIETRPSIKIAVENLKSVKFNSMCREKTFTVNIIFLAKDVGNVEEHNSKIQQIIESTLFEDLYVEEKRLTVSNINTQITETHMKISFELDLLEILQDAEEGEPMETLNYKEELND